MVDFMRVGGTEPDGADLLRERVRWAMAERRWHPPRLAPVPRRTTPTGQGALRGGAQLTRLTTARVAPMA